jgi:hypothetical protein
MTPRASFDAILGGGSYAQGTRDPRRNRGAPPTGPFLSYDPSQGRFECSVFIDGGGSKGQRQAVTSGDQAIGCFTPRKWNDIQKQVKFGVESYDSGNFQDRAPNDGRYRGL